MKNLMSVLLLASSFFIHNIAQAFEVLPGDLKVFPIKGDLEKISPLCPEGVYCITNGSILNLSFKVKGCADRVEVLGRQVAKSTRANGEEKFNIYLSVVQVANEMSQRVDCVYKEVKLDLSFPNKYFTEDNANLIFMGM